MDETGNPFREFLIAEVENSNVGPFLKDELAGTLLGDPGSAFWLANGLGDEQRGKIAVALWKAKVPVAAFRAYLAFSWEESHRSVIEAAKADDALSRIFRYADFPLPVEWPDMVTVWRGTSALTIGEARNGYSWTIDRDTACWFAMRFEEANGSPLVLVAEVAKTDIALFHGETGENEVVLVIPPAFAKIDGGIDDWAQGYERKDQRLIHRSLGGLHHIIDALSRRACLEDQQ